MLSLHSQTCLVLRYLVGIPSPKYLRTLMFVSLTESISLCLQQLTAALLVTIMPLHRLGVGTSASVVLTPTILRMAARAHLVSHVSSFLNNHFEWSSLKHFCLLDPVWLPDDFVLLSPSLACIPLHLSLEAEIDDERWAIIVCWRRVLSSRFSVKEILSNSLTISISNCCWERIVRQLLLATSMEWKMDLSLQLS